MLGGELPAIAAPAQGVSRSGYLRWRIRHGIDSQPKAIKCSVFKSVAREIRDSTTRAICARFGVNPDTYWNRRAVVSEDLLEGILRLHRVVRKRLNTDQICAKHGITTPQLYCWRKATGGMAP